ncbi:hypothetical protein M2165_000585 [Variovorax sp. TBS-050B]|nr:hypothetical protein [Variovorax sp. TBS-050B]
MTEERKTSDESNELIESILSDYEEHEKNLQPLTVSGWGCRGMCCIEAR